LSSSNKYDPFEKLIQDKLDGLNDDYGKSWSDIAEGLDKKDKGRNKFNKAWPFFIFIIGITSFGSLLLYNNTTPLTNDPVKPIETTKQDLNSDQVNKPLEQKSATTKQDKITKKKDKSINTNQTTKNEIKVENNSDIDTNIANEVINDTISNLEEVTDSLTLTEDSVVESIIVNNVQIISKSNMICINDTFQLSHSTCESCNIIWMINDSIYSENHSFLLPMEHSGKFTLTLHQINFIDSTPNNTLLDSLSLEVHDLPKIDFTYETTEDNGIIGTYFTPICNNDISGNIRWDFGDGDFSTSIYPRHEYLVNGDFIVNLNYQDINKCSNYIQKEINITSNKDILAPNTFTPNGDGINDIFMPEGVKISGQPFEMKIFNKSGKLIFLTKNANDGWNGFNQSTGNKCTSDNYLWVIEITNDAGNVEFYKGTILLLK